MTGFPYALPTDFEKHLGALMALTDAEQTELLDKVRVVFDVVQDNQIQLRGIPDGKGGFLGWPMCGKDPGGNRTLVSAIAAVLKNFGLAPGA